MFTIKFRRKRGPVSREKRFAFTRPRSREKDVDEQECTVPKAVHPRREMHLSMEYFVDGGSLGNDGPPDLLEDSFASTSSDEQESLNCCSLESSPGRRVSFLLPPGEEKRNRSPVVPSSSALSAESLLRGEIPLSKPVVREEFDVHVASASIPGNKIWLVGTMPIEPQEEDEDSVNEISEHDDIDEIIYEDVPYDEKPKSTAQRASRKASSCDSVPFDERCDCCGESPSPSCAICQNVKVFQTNPGCWQIKSNESTLCVSLPPYVTLKTSLQRDIVIDSDLPEDLTVCVDEKDWNGWNVESFLLVLVQLVLLKVSASI